MDVLERRNVLDRNKGRKSLALGHCFYIGVYNPSILPHNLVGLGGDGVKEKVGFCE